MTLALAFLAVTFSHSLHLKMVPECTSCHAAGGRMPAKAVCARCHQDRVPEFQPRAKPVGLKSFSHEIHTKLKACRDCHGAGEPAKMAGCIVCHNQVSPPDSCAFCHTASAKLKPASHTPDWVDVHSSGKLKFDKSQCAVCHGTNFTCQGCH